jgi:hypothetical protein
MVKKDSDYWSSATFWVTIGSLFIVMGVQFFIGSDSTYNQLENLMVKNIELGNSSAILCNRTEFINQQEFIGRLSVFNTCISNSAKTGDLVVLQIKQEFNRLISNLLGDYFIVGWLFFLIGLIFLYPVFEGKTVKPNELKQILTQPTIWAIIFASFGVGLYIVLQSISLAVYFVLLSILAYFVLLIFYWIRGYLDGIFTYVLKSGNSFILLVKNQFKKDIIDIASIISRVVIFIIKVVFNYVLVLAFIFLLIILSIFLYPYIFSRFNLNFDLLPLAISTIMQDANRLYLAIGIIGLLLAYIMVRDPPSEPKTDGHNTA